VASMVAKPTGDDGGVLFVLALILAAAVAGAFTWRRRMSV
jgi:LPXTG-motif cell wall-anchored protein